VHGGAVESQSYVGEGLNLKGMFLNVGGRRAETGMIGCQMALVSSYLMLKESRNWWEASLGISDVGMTTALQSQTRLSAAWKCCWRVCCGQNSNYC